MVQVIIIIIIIIIAVFYSEKKARVVSEQVTLSVQGRQSQREIYVKSLHVTNCFRSPIRAEHGVCV
jgi:hypothetical protein